MSKKINIYEAKSVFSSLIKEVAESQSVVTICRNGQPVVDMVPHRAAITRLRPLHELKGAKYNVDPVAGLDESDWPESSR